MKTKNPLTTVRGRSGAVLLAFVLLSYAAPAAWATAPVGACCFTDGSCDDLADFVCETAGGAFIGAGTSCANVNCRAPIAAPLLSVAGLVAAATALGGIGLFRILSRRRP